MQLSPGPPKNIKFNTNKNFKLAGKMIRKKLHKKGLKIITIFLTFLSGQEKEAIKVQRCWFSLSVRFIKEFQKNLINNFEMWQHHKNVCWDDTK